MGINLQNFFWVSCFILICWESGSGEGLIPFCIILPLSHYTPILLSSLFDWQDLKSEIFSGSFHKAGDTSNMLEGAKRERLTK